MSHLDFKDLVTASVERLEEREKLLDTWRIALQTIARGDSGMWGAIALEALDKEKKP